MRLLNTITLKVEEFLPNRIPRYAILSHTWEDGEVTFQDMENQTASTKAGYAKLLDSAKEALNNGFDYIWIDTCCIDKTSSAELSEAINAMFRWCKEAVVCYAFLADVPSDTTFDAGSPFANSKWFTRGWTLQELLAPDHLEFYSTDWSRHGSKSQLGEVISSITGIDGEYLKGRPLFEASIAARMSWASKRRTTREEERAYSLLGVFDIRLPLLYGEGGANSFFRLQEELIRTTEDQSIFAWHSAESFVVEPSDGGLHGSTSWLAASPDDFLLCGDIVSCRKEQKASPFALSNAGILMDMTIVYDYERVSAKLFARDFSTALVPLSSSRRRRAYASLMCRRATSYWNVLAIPVEIQGDKCSRICSTLRSFDREWSSLRSIRRKLYSETPRSSQTTGMSNQYAAGVVVLRSLPHGYTVDSVVPQMCWEAWTSTSGRLLTTHEQARYPSFLNHVISIRSNYCLGEPQHQIFIWITPNFEGAGVKHIITMSHSRPPRLAQMDDSPESYLPFGAFVSSLAQYYRRSRVIRSQKYKMYLRVHVESNFALGMDVVDLVADYSLLRNPKAYWSLYRGWETSTVYSPYSLLLGSGIFLVLPLAVYSKWFGFFAVALWFITLWRRNLQIRRHPIVFVLFISPLFVMFSAFSVVLMSSTRPVELPMAALSLLASLSCILLLCAIFEPVWHARFPFVFWILIMIETMFHWRDETWPDRMVDPTLSGRNV